MLLVYKLDVADVFHSKWLNCVKDIITACGYANCWRNQPTDRLLHLSKKFSRGPIQRRGSDPVKKIPPQFFFSLSTTRKEKKITGEGAK
jgi:hypothetical protein